MSDSSSHKAPGLVWILGAFAGFAVLTALAQNFYGNEVSDPAAEGRLANKKEIVEAQLPLVEKMKLVQGKSIVTLAAAIPAVQALKPEVSTVPVPGSPTQLKQAAAVPPAPIAPAAAAPLAVPVPTAQPAKP
jgi:hypothetical protein